MSDSSLDVDRSVSDEQQSVSLLDEQSEYDVYEAYIQLIIFESESESGQLVMLTLSPL